MTTTQEHGRVGHINTMTLDQDSVITGYGKHARVVCFAPDGDGLYCRIDRYPFGGSRRGIDPNYPQLRDPTISEVLTVARKDQGVRGKWKLRDRVEWDNGRSVDMHFDPQ